MRKSKQAGEGLIALMFSALFIAIVVTVGLFILFGINAKTIGTVFLALATALTAYALCSGIDRKLNRGENDR